MIHVIAVIDLNPGTRDAFVGEMKKIVPLVKAENGCIEYGPAVDLASGAADQLHLGENTVVVVEKWARYGGSRVFGGDAGDSGIAVLPGAGGGHVVRPAGGRAGSAGRGIGGVRCVHFRHLGWLCPRRQSLAVEVSKG